jgi:hypothetical protein
MPVGGWQIVLLDLESGVTQRLPFEENYRIFPAAWGADGGTLLVGLFHPAANAFQKARLYTFASGSWQDISEPIGSYMSIAPNGIDVVYSDFRTGELFVRALLGDAPPIAIPGRGFAASYSPDGRWLAWGDVDGGVTVSPLPPTGAVYPVAERGQQPIWTSGGRAVLYRDGRRFYQVTIDFSDGVRTAPPRLLVARRAPGRDALDPGRSDEGTRRNHRIRPDAGPHRPAPGRSLRGRLDLHVGNGSTTNGREMAHSRSRSV